MENNSSRNVLDEDELLIESNDDDCLVKDGDDLYIFQPDKIIVIYRESSLH